MTLAEEHDGVCLTCLDHGSANPAPGDRPVLALAAARRLAEEGGGALDVVSHPPGHGAMIRLRLPLHRPAQRLPADGAWGNGAGGAAP